MIEISQDDYYKLIGLGELAKEYNARMDDIAKSMAEIVGQEEDEFGSFGHVSDAVFEPDPARRIIYMLDVKIKNK